MQDPIQRFLELFNSVASETADAWCGDHHALRQLFKGTAYAQRYKDWFPNPASPLPRRTIQLHEYRILRQLLSMTRGRNGAPVNSEAVLEDLDRAYDDYRAAMNANDARRHRHLTGRTLHVDAARQRVERFLSCRGYSFEDFRGFDFFQFFYSNDLMGLLNSGKLQEFVRVARALFAVIEHTSNIMKLTISQQRNYAACCSIMGRWAALHCDDLNAQGFFIDYLRRIHAETNDPCVQTVLWSNGFVRGDIPDGHLRAFAIHAKDTSSICDLVGRHPFSFHTDAADNALKLGACLTERITTFGDRTPEEIIRDVLDGGYDEGPHSGRNVHYFVLSSCCYSRWLAKEARLDEAQVILQKAEEILGSSSLDSPYLDFSLRESEALIYTADWEASRSPSALVRCFRALETAAAMAEKLNLHQRAEKLRKCQPN